MTLPPVLRATHVTLPPAEAFELFTDHLGAWWPLISHSAFGVASGGVDFIDGQVVERSTAGVATVWGEVLAWQPGSHLAMTWHPGRTAAPATRVEVRFVAAAGGTLIELNHTGWEAFADAAGTRTSYAGRDAWGTVLDHFADLAEWGGRARIDLDLVALRAAYGTFFTAALAGGFAEPKDGGFTAHQVVAHVAVNDDAMAAICRAVIAGLAHGQPTAEFRNDSANDRAVLQALIERHGGDLRRLIDEGRRRCEHLLLLLARLDADEREVVVHAHLSSDGQVTVDDDLPWGRVAVGVQTAKHLPAHTEQLRALRRR